MTRVEDGAYWIFLKTEDKTAKWKRSASRPTSHCSSFHFQYALVFERPGAEYFCFCSRTDSRLFSFSRGYPSSPPRPLPLVSGGTNGAASNGASGAGPLIHFVIPGGTAAGRQQHGIGAAAPSPGGAGMNLNAFQTAFQGNVGTGPAPGAPVLVGGFALGTDGGLCVCVRLCVRRNI